MSTGNINNVSKHNEDNSKYNSEDSNKKSSSIADMIKKFNNGNIKNELSSNRSAIEVELKKSSSIGDIIKKFNTGGIKNEHSLNESTIEKELNSVKFGSIQDHTCMQNNESFESCMAEIDESIRLESLQEAEMAQEAERYENTIGEDVTSNEEEVNEEKDKKLESLYLDSYEQQYNIININDVPQVNESEDEIKSSIKKSVEIIILEEIKNPNVGVNLIKKKFNKSIDLSEQCEVNDMVNKSKDIENRIIFDEIVHEKSLLIKCASELPTESINKYEELRNQKNRDQKLLEKNTLENTNIKPINSIKFPIVTKKKVHFDMSKNEILEIGSIDDYISSIPTTSEENNFKNLIIEDTKDLITEDTKNLIPENTKNLITEDTKKVENPGKSLLSTKDNFNLETIEDVPFVALNSMYLMLCNSRKVKKNSKIRKEFNFEYRLKKREKRLNLINGLFVNYQNISKGKAIINIIKSEKNTPQTIESEKDTPQTIEIDKDTPQTIEIDKDTPQTIEIEKDTPQTIEIEKDTPQTIESEKDTPQTIESEKDTPQTIESEKDTPQITKINKVNQYLPMVIINQEINEANQKDYSKSKNLIDVNVKGKDFIDEQSIDDCILEYNNSSSESLSVNSLILNEYVDIKKIIIEQKDRSDFLLSHIINNYEMPEEVKGFDIEDEFHDDIYFIEKDESTHILDKVTENEVFNSSVDASVISLLESDVFSSYYKDLSLLNEKIEFNDGFNKEHSEDEILNTFYDEINYKLKKNLLRLRNNKYNFKLFQRFKHKKQFVNEKFSYDSEKFKLFKVICRIILMSFIILLIKLKFNYKGEKYKNLIKKIEIEIPKIKENSLFCMKKDLEITECSKNEFKQTLLCNQENIIFKEDVPGIEFLKDITNKQVKGQERLKNDTNKKVFKDGKIIKVTDKEITNREVKNKEVFGKKFSDKEVSRNEITKKEITDKDVKKREITDKDVNNSEITDKEVKNREITDKEVKKREIDVKILEDVTTKDLLNTKKCKVKLVIKEENISTHKINIKKDAYDERKKSYYEDIGFTKFEKLKIGLIIFLSMFLFIFNMIIKFRLFGYTLEKGVYRITIPISE